jgi:hypothetical protein
MMPIPCWKDGLLWIFGLLLLAAFLGVFAPKGEAQVGAPNQIQCNTVFTVVAPAIGNAVQIPAVAGKTINVCGWHITNSNAAAGAFSITSGTQVTTPCDTGTKTLANTITVSQNAPSADHIEFAQFSSLQGQALCINPTVATLSFVIWYVLT